MVIDGKSFSGNIVNLFGKRPLKNGESHSLSMYQTLEMGDMRHLNSQNRTPMYVYTLQICIVYHSIHENGMNYEIMVQCWEIFYLI